MIKKQKQILHLVIAAAAISVLLSQQGILAYAAQEYVAGYSHKSPVTVAAVWTRTSFAGTTPSGIGSTNWIGSITSTAGFPTTTGGIPTFFSYQIFPALYGSDDHVIGDSEVWKNNGAGGSAQKFDCSASIPPGTPACPDFGLMTSINSILSVISFQDVAKTKIRYHFEVQPNGGPIQIYDVIATKSVYDSTDNTKYFSVGYSNIASPVARVKWAQFGVEQGNTGNTGWSIKQTELKYTTPGGSVVNLSTSPAYAIKWSSSIGSTYDSILSFRQVGTNYYFFPVGKAAQTSAGADYDLKAGSSLPKGEVRWYWTTTTSDKISAGTQLWN